MEWTKLNKKEVIYYCKSFEVDFSCSPFSLQLEELVLMFHYYGIEQFTVKDIQDFYQKMQIPKPKSQGLITPTPGKIRQSIGQMQNVKSIDENTFEIVPAEKGHFCRLIPAFIPMRSKKDIKQELPEAGLRAIMKSTVIF